MRSCPITELRESEFPPPEGAVLIAFQSIDGHQFGEGLAREYLINWAGYNRQREFLRRDQVGEAVQLAIDTYESVLKTKARKRRKF